MRKETQLKILVWAFVVIGAPCWIVGYLKDQWMSAACGLALLMAAALSYTSIKIRRIEEMPKGVEEEERKAMPIEKEIPPPEEKPELMPQKPEVLKAGKIRLNVWRNVNKFGKTIKTVEVQRVYKDKEGRFKDTYRLRKNDIPKAIALLRRQYERMLEIEEE